MNPQQAPPSFELPIPPANAQGGQAAAAPMSGAHPSGGPLPAAPAAPMAVPVNAGTPPTVPPPAMAGQPVQTGVAPAAPAPAVSAHAASAQAGTAPQAAEDVDLIEKAWVEKAKEIVGRTRTDPYTQNTEMSRLKADYLKKRYSKEIKLNE